MANNSVWQERRDGTYVDLFTETGFSNELNRDESFGTYQLKVKKSAARHLKHVIRKHKKNNTLNGLSEKVRINSQAPYGRHLQAAQRIDFDEKVAGGLPYVAVIDHSDTSYCIACAGEVNINTYRCSECNSRFCGKDCSQDRTYRGIHRYECGTPYHNIIFGSEIIMKCVIKMVIKALVIFDNDINQLKTAVRRIVPNINNNNTIPGRVLTAQEEFECVMLLEGKGYPGLERECFETFSIIMQFPEIQLRINNEENKRFLKHLLAHYLKVANVNCFETDMNPGIEPTIRMSRLFHTLSFFNHSCSPNVLNFLEGPKMHCITCRPIEVGEQLFIDYKQFSKYITTENRREELEKAWGFECDCVRCQYFDNNVEGEISSSMIITATRKTDDDLKRKLERRGTWTLNIGACIIAYDQRLSHWFVR